MKSYSRKSWTGRYQSLWLFWHHWMAYTVNSNYILSADVLHCAYWLLAKLYLWLNENQKLFVCFMYFWPLIKNKDCLKCSLVFMCLFFWLSSQVILYLLAHFIICMLLLYCYFNIHIFFCLVLVRKKVYCLVLFFKLHNVYHFVG